MDVFEYIVVNQTINNMGTSTKAIINKNTSVFDIEKALNLKYHNVKVSKSGVNDDFYYFTFDYGNEVYHLNAFFNDYALISHNIDGVSLSIGCSDESITILRYLCECFGGFLDENDCDDESYYSINYHLFCNISQKTNLEVFKEKLLMKVGYDKLESVLKLLEEYKNIA